MLAPWKKSYDQPRQPIKKQEKKKDIKKIKIKSRDITLPTKVRLIKAMVFQWSCMDMRFGL